MSYQTNSVTGSKHTAHAPVAGLTLGNRFTTTISARPVAVTSVKMQDSKTIDQSTERFIATVPLLKTFTEAELRKLESLIIAELNARALKKALNDK